MRFLRAPALHMTALGTLLFLAIKLPGGGLIHRRPRIEIAAHRVAQMRNDFIDQNSRQPSPEEWQSILDAQIDDEVLFQYALALGMHENSAARTRLVQIAEFVEANPHESTSPDESAKIAMKLGLHEGDLIVRRILTDSARRLIRAVVLIATPKPELVERFYATNPERYILPARVAFVQVAANEFKWPDTAARAAEMLAKIREARLEPAAALALGDETVAPKTVSASTEQGLEAEFGRDFAQAVMQLPVGAWSEPIASRYGHHLVFVQAREEARMPPLDAIRAQVEQQLKEKLADDWLKLRLRELRAEFEIVLPEGTN